MVSGEELLFTIRRHRGQTNLNFGQSKRQQAVLVSSNYSFQFTYYYNINNVRNELFPFIVFERTCSCFLHVFSKYLQCIKEIGQCFIHLRSGDDDKDGDHGGHCDSIAQGDDNEIIVDHGDDNNEDLINYISNFPFNVAVYQPFFSSLCPLPFYHFNFQDFDKLHESRSSVLGAGPAFSVRSRKMSRDSLKHISVGHLYTKVSYRLYVCVRCV